MCINKQKRVYVFELPADVFLPLKTQDELFKSMSNDILRFSMDKKNIP
jgi:hypothetical protein